MAVWLTEDNKVILRNGKVYTGDRKPCGYVILQKCVFKAGSQSASPSYKRTKEIIQISDFCKYPDATTWFDANSSEYPTSGEESYTLLKPSDVTGDKVPWLTCDYTANDAAAVECPTYDPAIYYVHSKCDADDKNPETGKLSCIVSTKDEEKGYTLYGGPYTYSKARDEAAARSGLPCSTGADYEFVVMSDGCDCRKTPARHTTIIQSYAVGSPAPSGTTLAGPFGTYAKAVEAANKVYKCSCNLYFGWDTCESLCGDHNAGETINYAVYGPFEGEPPYSYEEVDGPYSSYPEVEAAMAAKEKITCKCSGSATKWYLYKKCSNNKYTTTYNTTGTTPSGYTLHGSYDTYDQLRAAQSSVEGTSCGSSGGTWYLCVYSDGTEGRYALLTHEGSCSNYGLDEYTVLECSISGTEEEVGDIGRACGYSVATVKEACVCISNGGPRSAYLLLSDTPDDLQ